MATDSALFTPPYPQSKPLNAKSQLAGVKYNINWNDSDSVNRIKDIIINSLSKATLSEDDIYSMFSDAASALKMIEILRFGELSHLCDVVIDSYGRRTYHLKQQPIKTNALRIDATDKKKEKRIENKIEPQIQKEIKQVISALDEHELNALRAQVASDLSQANDDDNNLHIYHYINAILPKKEIVETKIIKQIVKKPDIVKSDKKVDVVEEQSAKKPIQKIVEKPAKSKEVEPETKKTIKLIQKEHENTVLKLQEIILRKNDEIQEIIALSNQQKELIRSLSREETKEEEDEDDDIDECLQIINDLKHGMIAFKANYNVMKVDAMGDTKRDMLINKRSLFNEKLNKYSQVIEKMTGCVKDFSKQIEEMKGYIDDKYVPHATGYEQWTLDEVIVWIKSLENGRFDKYCDKLRFGFEESEIFSGELVPDLNAGDLSVTPFNIDHFKDKRDLVQYFKQLRTDNED